MGIIVNNIKPIRIMFNGVEATLYHNGIKIWPEGSDPYNPLNLPPNTVRVRTNDGQVPTKENDANYETATLVTGTTDVYDIYKSGDDFSNLLYGCTNITEVLGANTTGILGMKEMLAYCQSLTSVQLFDTSSVLTMDMMFYECRLLTSIPLYNTSSVINMNMAFFQCRNVQFGALTLYQQASSQSTPPAVHQQTFRYCGEDTTTGAAELAQIPSDWK